MLRPSWKNRLPEKCSVLRKKSTDVHGLVFSEDSAACEALRNFTSSLILESKEREIVVISSAVGGEGKTAISLNLAVQLSKFGKTVLLIDGNLDQPLLTEILDLKDRPGLAEIVENGSSLSDVVSEIPEFSIDAIGSGPTGNIKSRAAFFSDVFKQVLKDAKAVYNAVILDTPSMKVSNDFLHLAEEIDKIVLVVAPGVVTKSQLLWAKGELEKVRDKDIRILLNRHKESIPQFLYKWLWGAR